MILTKFSNTYIDQIKNKKIIEIFNPIANSKFYHTGSEFLRKAQETIVNGVGQTFTHDRYQLAKDFYQRFMDLTPENARLYHNGESFLLIKKLIAPVTLQGISLYQTGKHFGSGLLSLKTLLKSGNLFKEKINLVTNICREAINVGAWGSVSALSTYAIYDSLYSILKASPSVLQEKALLYTGSITVLNLTLPSLLANPLRGTISGVALYGLYQHLCTSIPEADALLIVNLLLSISNIALPILFSSFSAVCKSEKPPEIEPSTKQIITASPIPSSSISYFDNEDDDSSTEDFLDAEYTVNTNTQATYSIPVFDADKDEDDDNLSVEDFSDAECTVNTNTQATCSNPVFYDVD